MADETKNRELTPEELASVSGGTVDGINRLIAVTQIKTSNANDDAMAGALGGAATKGPKRIG